MAEAAVLFVDSWKVLMKEVEVMRTRAASVETMLEGNAIALCERWGASAVLLKNGEIAVVEEAAKSPVDIASGGAVFVKLYEGGSLGRGRKRDLEWFIENVDKVYLGALQLHAHPHV